MLISLALPKNISGGKKVPEAEQTLRLAFNTTQGGSNLGGHVVARTHENGVWTMPSSAQFLWGTVNSGYSFHRYC